MKKQLLRNMLVAIAALFIAIIALPTTAQAQDSNYDLVLESYGTSKIPVIKVVMEITGLGLKEANELVSDAPCIIKENIQKSDADAGADKGSRRGKQRNEETNHRHLSD